MPPVPLVRIVRSGFEESTHLGSVAVSDASGRLVAFAGDPQAPVFVRSAMKPLQAAVSLRIASESGGTDRLGDAEVAVAAGSHSGEGIHLETVRRLLELSGSNEDDLLCPPALPLGARPAREATGPRRLYHNCSGKHAAILLACAAAGFDRSSYVDPGHPVQREVLTAVRGVAGEPTAVGIDGCGVPVHALPLADVAMLYARLARPDALGGLEGSVRSVTEAMRERPELVEGPGRIATEVMRARPGVLAKGGAEGVACAASIELGVGVAVKVLDGGDRAALPALVRALREAGVFDDGTVDGLGEIAAPVLLGGGREVGGLVTDFRLSRAD